MQLVDDPDNGVIDRHKPGFEQQRGFASTFKIDQFAGAGHPRRIASDQWLAFDIALFVERLNPQHRDAFETLVHDARRQCADDLAEEHYDASSPSSSCTFASLYRVV